jgi:hypothetical protein
LAQANWVCPRQLPRRCTAGADRRSRQPHPCQGARDVLIFLQRAFAGPVGRAFARAETLEFQILLFTVRA